MARTPAAPRRCPDNQPYHACKAPRHHQLKEDHQHRQRCRHSSGLRGFGSGVVACLGSSALRRTREKVDLPLFLGPHTTTTGGVGWEETVDTAEAQSGGTTASVRGAGEDDRGGVRVGVPRGPAMSRCLRCGSRRGRAQSGTSPG